MDGRRQPVDRTAGPVLSGTPLRRLGDVLLQERPDGVAERAPGLASEAAQAARPFAWVDDEQSELSMTYVTAQPRAPPPHQPADRAKAATSAALTELRPVLNASRTTGWPRLRRRYRLPGLRRPSLPDSPWMGNRVVTRLQGVVRKSSKTTPVEAPADWSGAVRPRSDREAGCGSRMSWAGIRRWSGSRPRRSCSSCWSARRRGLAGSSSRNPGRSVVGEAAVVRAKLWQRARAGRRRAAEGDGAAGRAAGVWTHLTEALCVSSEQGAYQKARREGRAGPRARRAQNARGRS
ncbi:hypothetical protein SPURM210S_03913 [Streptomyces purpurascens]